MAKLDTVSMLGDLLAAGLIIDIDPDWDVEQRYNYIIHWYSVYFCQTNWADLQDIARIVYSQRKFRGSKWIHKT